MSQSRVWTFIADNIFSLLSIITGVIVIILQYIGIIQGDPVLLIILVLLTFLATYQVVETNKKFERLSSLIEVEFKNTILSLSGVEIHKFPTPEEGFEYLSRKIQNATATIDHIAMADITPRWTSQYRKFRDAREKVLRVSKVVYRYIVPTDVEHQKIEDLYSWASNPEIKRTHIGAYNLCPTRGREGFPYPTIMIFDSKEVFLYFPRDIGEAEFSYSIKHPCLVEMFINYFNRAWITADVLNLDKIKLMLQRDVRS